MLCGREGAIMRIVNLSSLTIIGNRPAILYYGNPGLMFATTEAPETAEDD